MSKTLLIKTIGNTLNSISYISPNYASKIALNLFCKPRKGSYKEDQKTFINSAEKTTLKHNNIKIATYNWKANGDTILLAHGWESNSYRWEDLIIKLKKLNYNIVALDAPAHGATSEKYFNAVLYSECINVVAKHFKPQIIVGHSVGGMASGFYQHNHQNKDLEKLILLGAPSEFKDIFKRYTDMMGFNKKIINGLNNIVNKRFNNPPSHFSLARFSKKINTKTLIIHDKEDKIIPYNDAELIVTNLKNSTFITTNNLGHGLRGELVENYIIDFIKN